MEEIWKPIRGYEGMYEVSSLGNVKSLPRKCRKFERILKPYLSQDGYLRVGLSKDSKGKSIEVHRLVSRTFFGPSESGYECNHKDANKFNNSIHNLEYITHIENVRHAFKLKLRGWFDRRGTKNGSSKLSENQVLEIREIFSRGNIAQQKLAEKYGISRKNVAKIVYRKTWKHI